MTDEERDRIRDASLDLLLALVKVVETARGETYTGDARMRAALVEADAAITKARGTKASAP